jgi:hypothetical protein
MHIEQGQAACTRTDTQTPTAPFWVCVARLPPSSPFNLSASLGRVRVAKLDAVQVQNREAIRRDKTAEGEDLVHLHRRYERRTTLPYNIHNCARPQCPVSPSLSLTQAHALAHAWAKMALRKSCMNPPSHGHAASLRRAMYGGYA